MFNNYPLMTKPIRGCQNVSSNSVVAYPLVMSPGRIAFKTLLIILFVLPISVFAQVYFKIGGAGTQSGVDWDNAKNGSVAANIQNAINAGGTIYFAASPTNYGNGYTLNNNVTITGGFPASVTGVDLSGYNPNVNQTFFGGGGSSVSQPAFRSTNISYTIIIKGLNVGTGGSTSLGVLFETGFYIPKGNLTFQDIIARNATIGTAARNTVILIGGDASTNNPVAKSYTFRNCLFQNNVSGGNPAMEIGDIQRGSLLIENCSFTNNSSIKNTSINSASGGSGAITINTGPRGDNFQSPGYGQLTIRGSSFCGNVGVDHGAIIIQSNTGTTVENCNFSNNHAQLAFGSVSFNNAGGAINAATTNLRVYNTNFFNNGAADGGGAVLISDCNLLPLKSEIVNCNFVGNYLTNTRTAVGNEAGVGGGALNLNTLSGGALIKDSNFDSNWVTLSSTAVLPYGNGGAISNRGTIAELNNVAFYQNKTGGSSGNSTVYGADIYLGQAASSGGRFSPINNSELQLANAVAYTSISGNSTTNINFVSGNTFSNAVDPVSITPEDCPTAVFIATADLTPSINIDGSNFASSATSDFTVDIFEISGVPTSGTVTLRINRPSGWDITVPGITLTATDQPGSATTSNVAGGTLNSNDKWLFRQTATFIFVTLKTGNVIPANGSLGVGFTAARKASTANGTRNPITASIVAGSGGDTNSANNANSIAVVAN